MTIKLTGLLLIVGLALAACSQERDAESASATSAYLPIVPNKSSISALDTMVYRNEADVLAVRVARDLHVTDPALLLRIKNEYYARGRALRGYTTRYAADTAGQYAAIKAANSRTSKRLKTALTPAQYKAYAGRQEAYYARPYVGVKPLATRAAALATQPSEGLGLKKLKSAGRRAGRTGSTYQKVKYRNGAKIKRNPDGSLKIRQADGTKIKIDKDGHRTVKKGLF